MLGSLVNTFTNYGDVKGERGQFTNVVMDLTYRSSVLHRLPRTPDCLRV